MTEGFELFTQQEVADILHCEVHKVIELRRLGFLSGARYGKRWVYRGKDVEDFINRSAGVDFNNLSSLTEDGIKRLRSTID